MPQIELRLPPAQMNTGIDSLLDDEERQIRDSVRALVESRIAPEIAAGTKTATCRCANSPSSWASSGFSACTFTATAARGPPRSSYGLACLELEAVDSGSARWSRCRVRWRCSRIHALRQRRARSGDWLPDMAAGRRRSAASVSPSRTSVPTRPVCARAQGATVTTGSSTAPRCGSPTGRSPTSPSCGRAPTRASVASLVPTGTPGFTARDIKSQDVASCVGHQRAGP